MFYLPVATCFPYIIISFIQPSFLRTPQLSRHVLVFNYISLILLNLLLWYIRHVYALFASLYGRLNTRSCLLCKNIHEKRSTDTSHHIIRVIYCNVIDIYRNPPLRCMYGMSVSATSVNLHQSRFYCCRYLKYVKESSI